MADEKKPTKESFAAILVEHDKLGEQAFLKKYEKGYAPDKWLVRVDGRLYPMKAVWVAAHIPPANPSVKDYRKAFRSLRDLGHIDIVSADAHQRAPITAPTRGSVLQAMAEFRALGSQAFLDKYTDGSHPKSKYVLEEGVDYPLKALFAASHVPWAHHRHFGFRQAEKDLASLGFAINTRRSKPEPYEPEVSVDAGVLEGKRAVREMKVLRRNEAIVKLAKAAAKQPLRCVVCEFDFEKGYGSIGAGFIEAHHVDPISERDGEDKLTTIDGLALLCANCHRMIHTKIPCFTVAELRERWEKHGGK
ncbi:HNH endonuclease [Rhizobium ruizarguesonis]